MWGITSTNGDDNYSRVLQTTLEAVDGSRLCGFFVEFVPLDKQTAETTSVNCFNLSCPCRRGEQAIIRTVYKNCNTPRDVSVISKTSEESVVCSRRAFYPNVTTLRSGLCYRNSVCRLSVCNVGEEILPRASTPT